MEIRLRNFCEILEFNYTRSRDFDKDGTLKTRENESESQNLKIWRIIMKIERLREKYKKEEERERSKQKKTRLDCEINREKTSERKKKRE